MGILEAHQSSELMMGEWGIGGLDLIQNYLKLEKKT